jgi:hypothetical protein
VFLELPIVVILFFELLPKLSLLFPEDDADTFDLDGFSVRFVDAFCAIIIVPLLWCFC